MTQLSLLTDVVAPRARVNETAVEIGRRSKNKDRVLARLQQGPATNMELVAIGGLRAMARVWELKREQRDITVERVIGGLWQVTLRE